MTRPEQFRGWRTLWHLVFQRVRSLTLKRRQVGRAGRGWGLGSGEWRARRSSERRERAKNDLAIGRTSHKLRTPSKGQKGENHAYCAFDLFVVARSWIIGDPGSIPSPSCCGHLRAVWPSSVTSL